jgi:(R,R)-butanediol dehydrogenase/meso-butanediol dehydrogenase/diacetyl reductase
MKALRFHKARDLRIDDVPGPEKPMRDQVVLKISYCGICGTDLHEYISGPIILPVEPHPETGAKVPIILGHEFSAVVTDTGEDVTTVKRGDRVAIIPHLTKAGDYYTRRNLGQFSPATGLVGLTWHWGGMGEFAMVPEQNVVKLPDTVSDEQGALLEPAAVAVNAIDYAGIASGSTVLVTGAGPIGALAALAARAAGATNIFVYEPNAGRRARLEVIEGLSVFGGTREELLQAIADQTDSGVGVDASIECAGHHAALDLCIAATKRTGVITQVGFFPEKPQVDLFKLCEKGLRLIGCWGNDVTMGPRLVSMIASGKFPVEQIISGRVSLDDAITNGFDVLTKPGNDHLKILIRMNG